MVISIDGYELKCEACGVKRTEAKFDLGMTYIWSNQYATKTRLFCHRCGAVHDVKTQLGTEPVIERLQWQCSVPRKSYEG